MPKRFVPGGQIGSWLGLGAEALGVRRADPGHGPGDHPRHVTGQEGRVDLVELRSPDDDRGPGVGRHLDQVELGDQRVPPGDAERDRGLLALPEQRAHRRVERPVGVEGRAGGAQGLRRGGGGVEEVLPRHGAVAVAVGRGCLPRRRRHLHGSTATSRAAMRVAVLVGGGSIRPRWSIVPSALRACPELRQTDASQHGRREGASRVGVVRVRNRRLLVGDVRDRGEVPDTHLGERLVGAGPGIVAAGEGIVMVCAPRASRSSWRSSRASVASSRRGRCPSGGPSPGRGSGAGRTAPGTSSR